MFSFFSSKKYRSDRCINPFDIDKGHGKNLRKISKTIQKDYPEYPDYSVICDSCRKSLNKLYDFLSLIVSVDFESDTDLLSVSNTNTLAQDDLTDILSGLKNKFQSLSENDPLRVNILTILPEHVEYT